MRIVAGTWRGRALAAPPGTTTRPTSDRVRQAIFDMLVHAPWSTPLDSMKVLDAFAGTGAMALEALSRGAASATYFEKDPAALKSLRANIAACKAEPRTRVIAADATRPPKGEPHDLAFLDPPYDTATAADCVRAPGLLAIIPPRRRLYVQHRRGAALPAAPGWRLADERRFGDTMLTTFEREEAGG